MTGSAVLEVLAIEVDQEQVMLAVAAAVNSIRKPLRNPLVIDAAAVAAVAVAVAAAAFQPIAAARLTSSSLWKLSWLHHVLPPVKL